MSIFVIDGMTGHITTSTLPSGDLAVKASGQMEQVMFEVCSSNDGHRNQPPYYGWIVPSSKRVQVMTRFEERCKKISG